MKTVYTNKDLETGIKSITEDIKKSKWAPDVVIGILRGGVVPAIYLSHVFDVPLVAIEWNTKEKAVGRVINQSLVSHLIVNKKLLLVDDRCDSGETFNQILDTIENAYYQTNQRGSLSIRTACLHYNKGQELFKPGYWHKEIDNSKEKSWIQYPWEINQKETIK